MDTDSTPNLEGEHRRMHNGHAQAEGEPVGYARDVAICPPDWPQGLGIGSVAEAPFAKSGELLRWDKELKVRVRY